MHNSQARMCTNMCHGSRMYTNMTTFTDTHKYENPSQTYTNTSLLTYISAYTLTQQNSRKSDQAILAHWQWVKMTWSDFFLCSVIFYVRAYVLMYVKGPTASGSCSYLCTSVNRPYLCTSVSRFHLGPRFVRILVSMLRFCLSTYVLMSVKRLVFVYVCEGFSYLCVFVKIDCVFVFGLMYLCM